MDVSGDLDAGVATSGKVDFVPMKYSVGDEMWTCTAPEGPETLKAFYDDQRAGSLTKTSQVTAYQLEEYVAPYMEKGISVLYLCLSSGLSSSFNSACQARDELKERFPECDLYPIDSLAATGGMGILCERMVRNKDAGMTIEENYNDIVDATHRIKHWFLVQDLMYLKRGGRVDAASAAIGTALNIRPILIIKPDGTLDTVAKKHGNKAAAHTLLKQFVSQWDGNTDDVVYVLDADDPELGDKLEAAVRKRAPQATVRRCTLCPVIGAHTGPGMAAICFMGK